ncbi:O-acetyltransferase LpxA-like protein [Rhizobium gallicum]|uniref:Chloramphenicol acetyltransferase n=1 Tax=Rhizobium gallicum TaxID=56730 RepID=A0A1L5NHT2_9HYPH|nr:acyltransferase [Rhizobium gallicum]APO67485.1 O-acetyltransferase LpxA-like protein [Rhizobium gallicum]
MKILGGQYLDEDDLALAGVARVGTNVRVHSTAILVDLESIRIGSHVRIDAFCVISAANGYVELGSHIHIASSTVVMGGAGVVLSDFSGLSHGVRIYSVSDDYSGRSLTNPTVPEHLRIPKKGRVVVGRHAIIGSGSVVLPGCDIGEGSAVGALSVVHKPVPEWEIFAGSPARRIAARDRAILELEAKVNTSTL